MGGVWIDATVLMTKPLSASVFEYPFFVIKGQSPVGGIDPRWLAIDEWEDYFMAGQPHSLHFKFLQRCLVEYYKSYDLILDYLLLNHFAKMGRELVPAIKKGYDSIPVNNIDCESLSYYLRRQDLTGIENCLQGETYIFKLERKAPYAKDVEEGRRSLAFQILQSMD